MLALRDGRSKITLLKNPSHLLMRTDKYYIMFIFETLCHILYFITQIFYCSYNLEVTYIYIWIIWAIHNNYKFLRILQSLRTLLWIRMKFKKKIEKLIWIENGCSALMTKKEKCEHVETKRFIIMVKNV